MVGREVESGILPIRIMERVKMADEKKRKIDI